MIEAIGAIRKKSEGGNGREIASKVVVLLTMACPISTERTTRKSMAT